MSPETALPLQPPSAYEANRDIVFMTLPLLALSTYFYGARPAVLCLTAAFTAMLCDHLVAWLRHRPCDKTENSSIPSALVLVLLLPATVHYYVVVVSVAVAILLVGLELVKSSLEKILAPEAVSFSWLSVGILLASILVKLWMAAFNRDLSRRIGSAAMAATATDSLSDVVATSAVLLGTLVGRFSGLRIDGWVGILVAAFILRAGWGAAKDTLDPLLGQSPDPSLVQGVQETVLSHPEITGIHDLVIHDYGPGRSMMSLHAEVPMDADVLEVHDIIDNVERELKEKFHTEAVIHMDPIATHDPAVNAMRGRVAGLVREIDPAMTIHDFRMTAGPDHQNLIFDTVVPYQCALTDEEVKAAIAQKAGELEGGPYFTVVSIDRAYAESPEP